MAFGFYRSITIDYTKVSGAQSNFPVLVTGTLAYLATASNGGKVQSSSGYDIAFYSDSALTTLLDFERSVWNASTGACEFWVRIPSLSNAVNTVIYLAYGDASAATDLQNKTGVWDSNTVAAFHLNETPSVSGTLADSSASANSMTIASGGTGGSAMSAVSGPWGGKAVQFNSSEYNYYYGAQASSSGMGVNHSTLSLWWKGINSHAGFDSWESMFGTPQGSYPYHYNRILLDNSNCLRLQVGSEGDVSSQTAAVSTATWYHIAATFDGTNAKVYVNGSLSVTTAISRSTTDDVLQFGRGVEGTYDELRAHKTVRSANWIATEYASQSSPSTFYAVGSETTNGGGIVIHNLLLLGVGL